MRRSEDVLGFERHNGSTSKPSHHVGNPILAKKDIEIGFSGWVVVLLHIGGSHLISFTFDFAIFFCL
ncbi:MAG: hypothetical protein ACXWVW_10095 [Sulfuricurvum sp.]